MREQSYATVVHPVALPNGFRVVDHPEVKPLQTGAPTLGWDGDPRLVIYTDGIHHVLYRLEHDGEYRPVCAIEGMIGVETVNRLIARLVEIDSRRGWDPLAVIDAADILKRKHLRTDMIARNEDAADKLHFGLRWSHLPGVDIVRPKQAPTRG